MTMLASAAHALIMYSNNASNHYIKYSKHHKATKTIGGLSIAYLFTNNNTSFITRQESHIEITSQPPNSVGGDTSTHD